MNLEKWIKEYYDFDSEITIELLRSYTNDVYLITDSKNKYVLKLYNPVWRSESEILWEIDLIDHLIRKGASVAEVITAKNGKKVQTYSYDTTHLYAVVFSYAKGTKPTLPFTPELYFRVGQAAGTLHKYSDDFTSSHKRPSVDLQYLIDNSISLSKDYVSSKEYIFLSEFGSKLKSRINDFVKQGLDWGPVHGDLTLDNLHTSEDGTITFYDFDSSGFGWRAMELQGWVVLFPEKKQHIDAYLRGYQEVRQISENDINAAPYLQAAQAMWLREGMMALKNPKILKGQLKEIKTWTNYFGENL